MPNFILNAFQGGGDCCESCESVNVNDCDCGCAEPTECDCSSGATIEIPYAVTAKLNGVDLGYTYVFRGNETNCYYWQCGCDDGALDCDAIQLAYLIGDNKWEISLDGEDYFDLSDSCSPLGNYTSDGISDFVEVTLHTQCKEDFSLSCAECPESCL